MLFHLRATATLFRLLPLAALPALLDALPAQQPASQPATAVPDADLPAGAPKGMALIRSEELLRHATFLASDELAGRLTASPGQLAAARYIAKQFAELGLEPLGDESEHGRGKRDYFQWYELARTSLVVEKSGFVVGRDQTKQTMRSGYAVMLPQRKLKDLRVAGTLRLMPAGRELPAGMKLDDVIPMVVLKAPPLKNASIEQQFSSTMVGALSRATQITARLEKLGASVVVFLILEHDSPLLNVLNFCAVQPGKDLLRPAKSSAVALGGDMGFAGMFPSKSPKVFASPELSKQLLAAVGVDPATLGLPPTSERDGGGKPGTEPSDDAEPARGDAPPAKAPASRPGAKPAKLPEAPASLTLVISADEPAKACNVVAGLRGSDRQLQKEAVVYSAHMDHVGLRADGEVFNGADDNASGSSGLIAIAKAFAKGGKAPRRSMIFLSVSGEELGLWGSAWYTADPTWPIEQTIANVNIDMIGRSGRESGPDEIGVTPSYRHEAFSSIVQTAAQKAAPFGLTLVSGDGSYARSDHKNFADRGIPVVFFCDGEHEDYHMVTDHADKLDGSKMERVARLAFWTGHEVANAAERPETLGRQEGWLPGVPAPKAPKAPKK